MKTRQGYSGIDRVRIVAAFLVVAVHTSPLLTFGVLPDFIFTRIVARLAVPFFLAATGFFLLAPYAEQPRPTPAPIWRFVSKTASMYGISILLYLPVNLYAGHWQRADSIWKIFQMLFIDGTMYHLWYLPASILGVLLTWAILRYAGLKTATAVAAVLYTVGLLGDSYFGLVDAAPWLQRIFQGIFAFSDYTRNGLFYVPVFLLMGVWAAKHQTRPRSQYAIGFGVLFSLLLIEGLLLHGAGTQRHDSMYILLPACVFFLLTWLSGFKGPSSKMLRQISLLVYILHPWVIVLVRGAAKQLGLERWLIDNSVVHYLAVCAGSFLLSAALLLLKILLIKRKTGDSRPKRAWIDIDLHALAHNVNVLQALLPEGCTLMPAIKADAYGFGAVPVAKALHRLNVHDFCVASLSEGMELRKKGVRGNILILGYTRPEDAHLVKRYRLTQTVVDHQHALLLAQKKRNLPVHIKVDTGMHRLGERSDAIDKINALFALDSLDIQGVFTQLSCCDSHCEKDIAYTHRQLVHFEEILGGLRKQNIPVPKTHVLCSYGIINYPDVQAAYARPGLALYGIVDEACCIGPAPNLQPVFTLKTQIALTKTVYAGEQVGYGDGCVARRNGKIAVITIGYADGLPRHLSNGGGKVIVQGQCVPIIGNICMDQAMIDVTNMHRVSAGDEVTVIGKCESAEISIHEFSTWACTIPNEIVSRFGQRLERNYMQI